MRRRWGFASCAVTCLLRAGATRGCSTAPEAAEVSATSSTTPPPAASKEVAAAWLKHRCTTTFTKFKSVPDEVLLHRAEAYTALNQPYFALADLQLASETIQNAKLAVERCQAEIAALPEELVATVPATDQFVDRLVTPYLVPGVTLKNINAQTGRGLVTSVDLPAGSLVVRPNTVWLSYPLEDGICSCCGKRIGKRIIACPNDDCHEEYCSRECRTAAFAEYHGAVCGNKAMQSTELELYARYLQLTSTSGNESEAAQVSVLLLFTRVFSAALKSHCVPSALPHMRTLTGRMFFSPQKLTSDMMDLFRRMTIATHTQRAIPFEEMLGSLARLSANVFQRPKSVVADVPWSMLNHSCAPNCIENTVDGSIVTKHAVPAGSELTWSYFTHLTSTGLPFAKRREELQKRGFDCHCSSCVAGR